MFKTSYASRRLPCFDKQLPPLAFLSPRCLAYSVLRLPEFGVLNYVEAVETNLPTPQESKFTKDLSRISGDYFLETPKCRRHSLSHPLLAPHRALFFDSAPTTVVSANLLENLPPSTTGVDRTRPRTSHCSRSLFSTLFVCIAPLLLAPGLVSSVVKSAVEPNKDRLADNCNCDISTHYHNCHACRSVHHVAGISTQILPL